MLLAVRPDNSPHFMLAHVCWIMAVEGELQMGISMLAGAPRLVDLARTPDGSGEHEARGVLMPEALHPDVFMENFSHEGLQIFVEKREVERL